MRGPVGVKLIFQKIAYDYATDFIKAELHVGLTFSVLALQSMNADKTSRNTGHVGTTAQHPPPFPSTGHGKQADPQSGTS